MNVMLLPKARHIRRLGEKLRKGAPGWLAETASALKAYFDTPRKMNFGDFPKLTLASGTQWISYRKGDWALISRPQGEELTAAVLEFLEYSGFVDPAASRGREAYVDVAREIASLVQYGFSLKVEYLDGPDKAECSQRAGESTALFHPYGCQAIDADSGQGGDGTNVFRCAGYFPGEDFPQIMLTCRHGILLRIKAFPGYLERGLGSIEWRRS